MAIRLVTVDVFDTLLLRSLRSEQERLQRSDDAFLAECFPEIPPRTRAAFRRFRRSSQSLAYQALSAMQRDAELTQHALHEAWLRVLGGPPELSEIWLAKLMEVESRSVRANRKLAEELERWRARGVRVVAVSDTLLPAGEVRDLLASSHGHVPVDAIYSSADCAGTKRVGTIWNTVCAAEGVSPEQILHIGDDPHADAAVPQGLGMAISSRPRPAVLAGLRRMRGGLRALSDRIAKQGTGPGARRHRAGNRFEYGRDVLGPIVAEFCLRLWFYAAQFEGRVDARLLFCARGGLGIREVFERFIQRHGLPLKIDRRNLMISRLIAAKVALVRNPLAAIDELSREFGGGSARDCARALSHEGLEFGPEWDVPFEAGSFLAMLNADSGRQLRADIEEQAALFLAHLDDVAPAGTHGVLCDTGLYGSTLKMLAAGLPERDLSGVQFARANYKGHGIAHFARLTGLISQHDTATPLDDRSYCLRFWHLIESLFEIGSTSVKRFASDASGKATSNLGHPEWGEAADTDAEPSELLKGAIDYIVVSGPGRIVDILTDAEQAWQWFRRSVAQPTRQDAIILGGIERSVDFGRDQWRMTVDDPQTAPVRSIGTVLGEARHQLWRQGAIRRGLPVTGALLNRAIDPYLIARDLARRYRRTLTRAH